jgi:hypothetical protein
MEARQGRDAQRLDAQHESPTLRSGGVHRRHKGPGQFMPRSLTAWRAARSVLIPARLSVIGISWMPVRYGEPIALLAGQRLLVPSRSLARHADTILPMRWSA